MKTHTFATWIVRSGLTLMLLSAAPLFAADKQAAAEKPVSFSREILPILSQHCFACHGPDAKERKADLRLDLEDELFRPRDSGPTVVRNQPEKSLLIERIVSDDPTEVMPPPESKKPLTDQQKQLLRRWISEGAGWQKHWSFESLARPAGTLDEIVAKSQQSRGLARQPTAAPQTLVRRLSLDLIGLPPTLEQADAFAKQPTAAAYEKLVDDLLASPQFGEHWARMWLDLARYADTKGYEKDLGRTMWPYRDWVVQAFNRDLPLDQFTIEQLAGDLLPDATDAQRVATAFHRNTMSNDEGGTDDEEFRIVAVKDRVDTTIQVWMGLTMGCAKCHSHKYDPISQQEYYSLYAIFNQTEDADRYDDFPRMEVLSAEQKQQRDMLQAKVTAADAELKSAEQKADREAVSEVWRSLTATELRSAGNAKLQAEANGVISVSGPSTAEDTYTLTVTIPKGKWTALRLEAIPAPLSDGQLGVGRNPADPNFVVSELTFERIDKTAATAIPLTGPRADYSQDGWPVAAAIDANPKTGWAVSPKSRERHAAVFAFSQAVESTGDLTGRITLSQQYGNRLTLGRFRLSLTDGDPTTAPLLQESPEVRAKREQLVAAQQELKSFQQNIAQLPVLKELPADRQRQTKIQIRGNFLEQGDLVAPAILKQFGPVPEGPPNRLTVARWLVSRENPLTPRVWANRVWARLFGQGLVETEEDFGALGSPPTHPELLDWLAAEYRDHGWSLKQLLKTIVMSQTYQQSSECTAAARESDPRNLQLARGARFRLPAEAVRDSALRASGLISFKMGGPAVMPPQPAGLWRSTYNGVKWVDAEGEDRYRRGLYTYLKRTTPYPSFTTFDAGSGEVCQIRRIRTNTPLQALITLNDPVYLEAAAGLARRMISQSGDLDTRLTYGLRLALIRPVNTAEAAPLAKLYRQAQESYRMQPAAARDLIVTARGEIPSGLSADEFAAWIVAANAILNLDEFLTRN